MDTRQSTLVIVETLNEGEEGEKVILRRIALDVTHAAFSIAADEARLDMHRSPGDMSAVLVKGATRS